MHQTVNLTSPTSVVRIHPLPPNPTRSKLKSLLRVGFFLVQGLVDSRGGKQSERLRRSEVSTEDKTADTRCFLCASAQGANPPPPTNQNLKRTTFSASRFRFFLFCRLLATIPFKAQPSRSFIQAPAIVPTFTFDYVVCLKFIDVFDIISIWIGLIITDLP